MVILSRLWEFRPGRFLGILLGLGGLWMLVFGGSGDPAWAVRHPPRLPTPTPTPISLTVNLGTAEGELRFEPQVLSFQTGIPYQLHLANPSPMKHYFTAKDFADAIWTRKVRVGGAEIKGQINNLELKPAASLDWDFVPMQPGTYSVVCTIPGHQEGGMVGELVIQG